MTKTTTILYIFTKKMSKLCEEHNQKGNLKIYFFAMGFRVIILSFIKRYTRAIHISEIEINKIYSFIKFTYSLFFINHSMIYFLRNIHQIYINWTKIIGK